MSTAIEAVNRQEFLSTTGFDRALDNPNIRAFCCRKVNELLAGTLKEAKRQKGDEQSISVCAEGEFFSFTEQEIRYIQVKLKALLGLEENRLSRCCLESRQAVAACFAAGILEDCDGVRWVEMSRELDHRGVGAVCFTMLDRTEQAQLHTYLGKQYPLAAAGCPAFEKMLVRVIGNDWRNKTPEDIACRIRREGVALHLLGVNGEGFTTDELLAAMVDFTINSSGV